MRGLEEGDGTRESQEKAKGGGLFGKNGFGGKSDSEHSGKNFEIALNLG